MENGGCMNNVEKRVECLSGSLLKIKKITNIELFAEDIFANYSEQEKNSMLRTLKIYIHKDLIS
jgi:hypothetical protein